MMGMPAVCRRREEAQNMKMILPEELACAVAALCGGPLVAAQEAAR